MTTNAPERLRNRVRPGTTRVILGHHSPRVTEIYAEADREKAVEAMLEVR